MLTRIRHYSNTLFMRLLFCFLVIVLLLLSFNFLSLSYFKSAIHEEILKNNQQNVNKMMNAYEKRYKDIANKITFTMALEEDVKKLYQSLTIDYRLADIVLKKLQSELLGNSLANVDNVFLHIRHLKLVIEKGGLSDPATMFSQYAASAAYPEAFWEEQFAESFPYRVYPAATFVSVAGDGGNRSKLLIPLVVKQKIHKQMYGVALIDAFGLWESARESTGSQLVLLNGNNEVIFASDEAMPAKLPKLEGAEGYVQQDGHYYFYRQASESGITYVDIVPNNSIMQKVKQLELWLITVLILAIAVSIGASIWFSLRFYYPIKQIVEEIKNLPTAVSALGVKQITKVAEFDLINRNVRYMVKEHQHISKHVEDQHSLLRKYALIDKLKQIYFYDAPLRDVQFADRPYVLILFGMTFKPAFAEEIDMKEERTVSYIRELIQVMIAERFPDTFTFQIQSRQVASLLFIDRTDREQVSELLEKLKQVFDRDAKYCVFTIAVSDPYTQSSDLNPAYEQAQARMTQRRLGSFTQIIGCDELKSSPFILTPNREQEFMAQIQAGNESGMNQCMRRVLSELERKDAFATQYEEFVKSMMNRIKEALESHQLDAVVLEPLIAQIDHCYDLEDYESIWERASYAAAASISQKREKPDPITSFVTDYIETNFDSDIYLDALAHKLNITPGYLSTYFKEKTGMNFSDYLNMFRIEKAKHMLKKTDIPVVEIGKRVGYPSTNSFFRMFKKMVGHTPGNYRSFEKK